MKSARALPLLNIATALVMMIATGLVFFYAPTEKEMGAVQRIFYFHVPSMWVAGLAFLSTLVMGILYLRSSDLKWDRIANASVEIGLTFSLMGTLSGAVWARPIWNTWWTWDPRLTTVTITCLVYAAYMMLRAGITDPDRRARMAAVYGIVAFISVPITYFSIQLTRSIHPVVFGPNNPEAQGTGSPLTPEMRVTFFFCLFAFTVLFADLLWNRLRLEMLAERVEKLKLKFLSA